jgi:5-methylcytosine-specific restriction protein A
VFDAVATAMREVAIPLDRAAIVEALALADRWRAKVSEAIGAFDAAELWELDAATSMSAWLQQEARMTRGAATTTAQTAAVLRDLPVTAAAWQAGVLSEGQVQAILANVPARHRALFADHEAELVPALANLSVAEVAAIMRDWHERADALDPGPEPTEPERSLHHSQTYGGRFETKGSFDAAMGALIAAALGLATTPDADGESRTPAERRADAFAEICEHFLNHHNIPTTRRNRPHVNVVIRLEDLEAGARGSLIDYGRVDAAFIKTMLCDCGVHRVLTEGRSTVLDYGRSTRTVPDHLWKLLALRDGGCRVGGCERGPQWCHAHHVVPWEVGGETVLSNLVLKCSRHHHMGHKPGWGDKLLPDGTYEVTDPRGRVYVTRPPGLL